MNMMRLVRRDGISWLITLAFFLVLFQRNLRSSRLLAHRAKAGCAATGAGQ